MKKITLPNDGERMVPELHEHTLLYAEHITRYLSATNIVRDKDILDIACGSGYGSQLLAKAAKKVYGVDVSEQSIDYARQNFASNNIEYKVGNAVDIPMADGSVDAVVSFETIEHVKNYRKFLDETRRVLRNGGLFIVSTPNVSEFSEGNEFHEHEFKQTELFQLLKKYFKNVETYYQATWAYVQISDDELISKKTSYDIKVHNLSPLAPNKYLYFYFVCSDKPIKKKLEPIGALGGHYSARELNEIFALNQKVIGDHKDALAHYKRINKELTDQRDNLQAQVDRLNTEVHRIRNSKAYKMLRQAAKAGRAIRR
jgi:2-polyprenyl-3-methyl-5-hydroxy-6-metoxy-1,4-benzoquinol methylase